MERRSNSPTWWLPVVLALASLMISAFVGYNKSDRDLVQRVSVLEAHQEDAAPRLGRIEDKVDRVDGKIDRLSESVMSALGASGR